MGNGGRPSFKKRDREQARRERAKTKAEQRSRRSASRDLRTSAPPGEDPDIAHIVPGPQPVEE